MTQTISNGTNQDPFGAIAAPSAGPTPAGVDPLADPFASPDSIASGGGPRRPSMANLFNRLVVMKPISLDPAKPVNPDFAKTPDQTEECYTVDLTVLGSEKLQVWDPKGGPTGDGGVIEYETPFTFSGMWISQGSIIGKLKGVAADKDRTMLIGVVRRCPRAEGYKAGETPDTIDRKFAAWEAAGRPGKEPLFSWGVVDETPAQRQEAIAWYRGQ